MTYLTSGSDNAHRPRKATADVIQRSRCGNRFGLLHAHTIACSGCAEAITECANVRCPWCDVESPFRLIPMGERG